MTREGVAPQPPLGSVVIATRNRVALLERCLASLAEEAAAEAFELVVVDNGSTDSTPALLDRSAKRWPFVRSLVETKPGSARALHKGALDARGDLLVFVDDDMVAVPGFLARHLEAHHSHPGSCILGDIRSAPSRRPFDRMQAYIFDGARTTLSDREPGPLDYWSGNVSLPRSLYLGLGGYREAFGDIGYGKDVDFGHRLVAAGVRLRFAPEALTFHTFTEGFSDRLRKAYRVGVACAYLSEAHPELPIEPSLLAPGRWHTKGVVWVCRLIAAALEPFADGTTVPPGIPLTFVYDVGLRAATRSGVSDFRTGRTALRGLFSPSDKPPVR